MRYSSKMQGSTLAGRTNSGRIEEYYDSQISGGPGDLSKISNLHSLFYKMLSIALVDGAYKKYYPEEEIDDFEEINDFERAIKEAIEKASNSSLYRWRGKGRCFIEASTSGGENDIFDEVKSTVISVLTALFESRYFLYDTMKVGCDNSISSSGFNAEGYTFFAACPKCGKFFYKKRKDQVYCSEKCRAAESSLRHLRKKKDD